MKRKYNSKLVKIMSLFSNKKKREAGTVDFNRLPRHIAIIMDGNGRWAKRRGLPRSAGHAAGAEAFRTVATYCRDIGVAYLTVFAFSTENWSRPAEEVTAIMQLLRKYLAEAIIKMEREDMRLRILGDISPLPNEFRDLVARTNQISETLRGFQANICLNYGGRDDILKAASAFAADCRDGKQDPASLDQAIFSSYLCTAGLPDPDLIIRPSGEIRISNFLLWQSAYAEYYFTDVLWPDFGREELNRAIADFQKRSRRFGGI